MNRTTKLTDIVDTGSELDTLRVLRRKIAKTIDDSSSGRDIAALSRQLREVTERIENMEKYERGEDTVLDKIIRKHNRETAEHGER